MVTEYSYLVDAANEMHKLYFAPNQTTPGYVKAAIIGCNVLRELMRDDAFFTDVATLSNIRHTHAAEYASILPTKQSLEQTEEINAFNVFLAAEKRILIAGGMDKKLVDMLIGEIQNQLTAIQNEAPDSENIRLKVATLRRNACKFADSLRYEHKPSYTRSNLKKLLIAVGGGAIVAINASSLLATIGLNAPAAAVSNTFGSMLMGVGMTIVIMDTGDL